ncbi:MAG: hypothetical protein RL398_416 [Planctomycetota bacterium]
MLVRVVAFVSLLVGLAAQSPLQTGLVPVNQGNTGGGLYFDLEVRSTVTITQIDTWVGPIGTEPGALDMEIWLGPSSYFGRLTTPGLWAPIATARVASFVPTGSQQLQSFVLQAPLALGPGVYGVALRSQQQTNATAVRWNHAYTNGLTCSSSVVPGSCANTVHSTAELTVRGGAAQNAFLTGVIFSPRMWSGNLHYTGGGQPIDLARLESFGQGCAGGNGAPALVAEQAPRLGDDLAVAVANPPSGFSIGFAVYGLSNRAWYYLPLPLELGFYGMPGCFQYTDIVSTESFGPQARIEAAVPNLAALSGVKFYLQAMLPDPTAANGV